MIDAPEGTPWWAWLLGVGIVALCGLLGALWSRARRTTEGVARLEEQVTNTHSTNLRDDLDAVSVKVRELTTVATLTREAVDRVERYLTDMDKTVRAVQHSMDRRDKIHDESLADVREDLAKHLADVPRLMHETVRHCPYPRPKEDS